MKEESHNPRIDPELEARIVALVLGEASDFERDELNRLIEERPELAAFKKQIQSVHGLLRGVATGESVAKDDDWKLSVEDRSAVLTVMSGEVEEQSAKQVVNNSAKERKTVTGNFFWNFTKIAAVVLLVAITGRVAVLELFTSTSPERPAVVRQFASSEEDTPDSLGFSRHFLGKDFGLGGKPAGMDDAIIIVNDEGHFGTAQPAAVAVSDYEKHSTSALSAIRDSLDYSEAASTEGVNGSEPPSQPTLGPADLTAPDLELSYAAPSTVAMNGSGLSVDSVNGRTAKVTRDLTPPAQDESQSSRQRGGEPAVQNAGNVDFPFPKLAEGPGHQDASNPAEPVTSDASTVSSSGPRYDSAALEVPEITTESEVEERLSTRVYPVEDLVISVRTPKGGMGGMDSMEGGEGTRDAADKRLAALGLHVRSIPKETPGSSSYEMLVESNRNRGDVRRLLSERGTSRGPSAGDVEKREAVDQSFRSHGSGQGQKLSRGQSLKLEEPVLNAPGDMRDSPAAGQDADMNGATAKGESVVGGGGGGGGLGGFGSAGQTLADKRKSGISTKGKPKEVEQSSTNKPMDSGVDREKMGRLVDADGDGYKDELPRGNVTGSDSGGVTRLKRRTLDQDKSYGRHVSEPVTGPDTGQPRGKSMAEQAKQDTRWGYRGYARNSGGGVTRGGVPSGTSPTPGLETRETGQRSTSTRADVRHEIEERAKDSLGELSALNELHKNTNVAGDLPLDDYDTKDNRKMKGPQPQPKDERDELLRQSGRPAIAGKSHWYRYVPPMLEGKSGSMKKAPAKKSTAPTGLNEKKAEDEAFSTFSLHVSDVSFKLARAALARGEWPEAAKVRIEEFVNAFDYGDPMPSQGEKVACCLEQSIHPFLQQRNLLRVSLRTAAAGRSSNTPLRLTLLLDNSGSMERIDRQQTVRRAFALLAQQLKPIDQVTLISFARQPRLLADKVSGSQSRQLVGLIHDLPSEGGTNIEAALQLGFEKAQEQQVDNAQNRIILLTDGAVNLGNADPESLSRMITTMRNAGIAFDAAGISAEGLNDEILEALTRQGDGRYYLLDSPEAADDGFARQIAGALHPSAKNVKVQVEFNPRRVGRYKLLGFEKHRLKQEDFRNDKVDAAEMAAAEAGVAMYQFEAKPDGEGDVGSLSVRFRDLSTGQMIENRWPIPYQADAPRLDQAAPSLRIATSAALFAARLRGEPLGETVDLKTLSNLIAGLPDRDRHANRVGQLQLMIQQARQLSASQ